VPATAVAQEEELTSGLAREVIERYVTHDEKHAIPIRAPTSRMIDKDHQLPQDLSSPEAICILCEMPKLTTNEGSVIDTCVVCDELCGEIAARRREEKELERLKVERTLLLETQGAGGGGDGERRGEIGRGTDEDGGRRDRPEGRPRRNGKKGRQENESKVESKGGVIRQQRWQRK